MWLVWFDKKMDVDVICLFMLYLLVITPGLKNQHVFFANKKEGPDSQSMFVSVFL